jgi:hypothetical protein
VPRSRTTLLRVAFVATSAACAAVTACLPSVQFDASDGGGDTSTPIDQSAPPNGEGGPLGEGGPDSTSPNHEGGADGGFEATTTIDAPVESEASPPPPDASPSAPLTVSENYAYAVYSACAVQNGTLYCWGTGGTNFAGQLGFPDEDAGLDGGLIAPTAVKTALPASQIVQIATTDFHTCAIFGTTAYCWGDNYSGEIGDPADTNYGPTEYPVQGLPSTGVLSLAIGSMNTCALSAARDGGSVSNVYCWGTNGNGESGRPVSQGIEPSAVPLTGNVDGGPLGVIPNAVKIAGGGSHYCVITSTSKMLCWGSTDFYESGPAFGPENCPAGNSVTCSPQPIQVTLPGGAVPAEVAVGDYHSCALSSAGNVYCWGQNSNGQLGTSSGNQLCYLEHDAGDNCAKSPLLVSTISNIKHIYAGGETTCALDVQNHAWCWGLNAEGQVGNAGNYIEPKPVELLDHITEIAYTFDELAVGRFATCGRDGADVYCWGGGVVTSGQQTTPLLISF